MGYLSLKWYQGYILGNITAVFLLFDFCFTFILINVSFSPQIIKPIIFKLILPMATLLLLNLRYRKLFLEAKHAKTRP
jgi:cell shape-determining protein MreD